jgi:alginate biosynthesis protein AlgX
LRYYASDEYRAHPPKIVVWEFLPQHNVNSDENEAAFRQMIPAISGACDDKTALARWSGQIAATETKVLGDIKNQPLQNTFLYIEATDPVERNLRAEILYADGNADQIDLTRSTRMTNNGKYYLELGRDVSAPALHVRVLTDKPEGRLTARLCPYPTTVAGK